MTYRRPAEYISYKDVVCTAESSNSSIHPANTDFFDSLNVKHVSVERVFVNIGDDCFSPKTNGTDLYVNQMYWWVSLPLRPMRTDHKSLILSPTATAPTANPWAPSGSTPARSRLSRTS